MKRQNVTLATYIAGFALSIGLTLMAFQIVSDGDFVGWTLIWVLMGLAVAQLVVQLVFFSPIPRRTSPLELYGVLVYGISTTNRSHRLVVDYGKFGPLPRPHAPRSQ